jgi:hypothetical protein
MKKIYLYLCIAFVIAASTASAQVVYEPTFKSSYDFLRRTAQRGLIDLNDIVQPLPRTVIKDKLLELNGKKSELTPLEAKELTFYLKDYAFDIAALDISAALSKTFFKIPADDRLRFIKATEPNGSINVQPIAGATFYKGIDGTNFRRSTGFWAYGYLYKKIGYSFSFQEIGENGADFRRLKTFGPLSAETGTYSTGDELQFSDFRSTLSYAWKWGHVAIGRDKTTWGYGQQSNLVLSEKAAATPFLRLDADLTPWLSYNSTVKWLTSNVVDSSTVRQNVYGINTNNIVSKYISSHSFIFKLSDGIRFAVGESIIFNDQLKFGYLVPINFFRALSHYNGEQNKTGANEITNSQFFTQLNLRNVIPNTHLYGTFFLDEMSSKNFFKKDLQRNHSGYTVGASVTNWPLKNGFAGVEYTRTRPYNYLHRVPAQTYTHDNQILGHWIGANADQFFATYNYRVVRGLNASVSYYNVRKGSVGEDHDERGTPFLFGDVNTISNLSWQLRYEIIHDFFLSAAYERENRSTTATDSANNLFQFSANFGL